MSKAKVLELKHIAKMLNSHRDEAIEKRFVDSLLAITTNTKMMASIQTDLDCLLDITELLCNVCAQFKLLTQLLNAWLDILKHIPSDTKYTIFLVIDIDIFRKCAKAFLGVRSNLKQTQIVRILSSYMEGNKQKTTDWLKQLFHCAIPADVLGKMSLYLGDEIGTSDYNRWMVYLINKYSTFDEKSPEDSPNGIVKSTFYGDSTNAALHPALDRSKNPINSVDEWVLIHSSDDEEDANQNEIIPVAVASDSTVSNVQKRCLLKSKNSTLLVKKSAKPKAITHQTTNRSEEKPNRKRKSAEVVAKRAKKQLFAENSIDVDEIAKDVYDFDEDDGDAEIVLKKRRQVKQPKKKKSKPVAWPRVKVEPMPEKKQAQKVYTIRVKKPVGAMAKVLATKAEHHCEPVETDLLSNVTVVPTELQHSVLGQSSIDLPELSMTEADWIKNEIETPVIELKKVTKASQKAVKAPKLASSTGSPLKLIPMEIIANIEKINGMVKIDSNNNTGQTKRQRKSRSKDIISVGSTNKPQTEKKPQPRKLYTEPIDDDDSFDLDQAAIVTQPTEQSGQETDNASRFNISNKSNDEPVIETIDISAKTTHNSSRRIPSCTEIHADCDTLHCDCLALPTTKSTKDPIRITDATPLSTGTESGTTDASADDCCIRPAISNHQNNSHPSDLREVFEELNIAPIALNCILSILDRHETADTKNTDDRSWVSRNKSLNQ